MTTNGTTQNHDGGEDENGPDAVDGKQRDAKIVLRALEAGIQKGEASF
jgi:hypothetical protein